MTQTENATIKQLADQITDIVQKTCNSEDQTDSIGIEALLLALHQLSGFTGFINILSRTQQR